MDQSRTVVFLILLIIFFFPDHPLPSRNHASDIISRDDFVAYNVLPFESVRQGYRHVPLFLPSHAPTDASLYVNVTFA